MSSYYFLSCIFIRIIYHVKKYIDKLRRLCLTYELANSGDHSFHLSWTS
jgi:hypothetical protein